MPYFDHAATTKPKEEVLKLYLQLQNQYWYNPSSLYKSGVMCQQLLQQSIEAVKELLGCNHHRVVFTSGATEANNIAIYGYCLKYEPHKSRIITSKIEHPSVLRCYQKLEKKGFDVVYLDCDKTGIIDLKQLAESINEQTILVSIMWVNNIVGSIQPIEQVIPLVKKSPKAKLHVDAVQGLGKIKPLFRFTDVDFITMSAHKIGGIKGSGFLAYNDKIALEPVYDGAYQQEKIKSGTIDLASAVTCAKSLRLSSDHLIRSYEKVLHIYQYAYQKISELAVIILSNQTKTQSPYIMTVSIPKLNSETIMHALEQKDIYVGIGSACHAKIKTADLTIYNMTKDEKLATSFIRLCFNEETSLEDIDILVNALQEMVI